MNKRKNQAIIKIFAAVAYVAMVASNIVAVILPIEGMGTNEISDAYPNLFAPPPLTFAVWSVIYILLGVYTLYQAGFFRGFEVPAKEELIKKVSILFTISSLLNCAWIFSWNFKFIWLSLLLISGLITALILIALEFKKYNFTLREEIFLRLPFSFYLGWITIAFTANFIIFLVSINWGGFGLSETIWTIIVLVLGGCIAGAAIISYKDFAYGLVIIWAYSGILIKHMSANGFDGNYTGVIITCVICLAFLVPLDALTFVHRIEKSGGYLDDSK